MIPDPKNVAEQSGNMPAMPVPEIAWLGWNQKTGEFSVFTSPPSNFVRPCFEWCEVFVPFAQLNAANAERDRLLTERPELLRNERITALEAELEKYNEGHAATIRGLSAERDTAILALKTECERSAIFRKALEKLEDGPGSSMASWKLTWAHKFAGEAIAIGAALAAKTEKDGGRD